MLAEVVGTEEPSSFFPSLGKKSKKADFDHGRGSSQAPTESLSRSQEEHWLKREGKGEGEHLDVQRAAHSAPMPFFRSQKWATPDRFLAANRSTAAAARPSSQMRPPRFPLSRLVLWDRTAFGEAVDVDPKVSDEHHIHASSPLPLCPSLSSLSLSVCLIFL